MSAAVDKTGYPRTGVFDALLSRAAALVNRVLALDPEFSPRLDALDGRRFRIEVKGAGLCFDIRIASRAVNLEPAVGAADVTISGPPLALWSLLSAGDPLQALNAADVTLTGDVKVAQRLSALLGELDVDWEEVAAGRIGDIPAHQAGRWARRFTRWRRRTHDSLQASLGEYLQEEARYLPTRVEIELFSDEVDEVRDAVERAEARLARLERGVGGSR